MEQQSRSGPAGPTCAPDVRFGVSLLSQGGRAVTASGFTPDGDEDPGWLMPLIDLLLGRAILAADPGSGCSTVRLDVTVDPDLLGRSSRLHGEGVSTVQTGSVAGATCEVTGVDRAVVATAQGLFVRAAHYVPGEVLTVEHPAHPEAGDAQSAQQVRDRLAAVHRTGRTASLRWRQEQLAAITRLVDEQEEAIAEAIGADLGRDAVESWLGEIATTKGEAEYARKRLRLWMRRRPKGLPVSQQPGLGWVQYEPLGTVLIIGPWNYPVYLTLGPLVAAVAAGNCAVIKPSEHAPKTSALLASLLPRYLDPEAIVVVEGEAETTQRLLAAGFDHALFTGGTEVGRAVMAGAAPTLTPVTLELGGKSPVLVSADADLRTCARRLVWVKLLNSGQTCIAPDYVVVEESVKDELVRQLAQAVREQRAEAPPRLRIVNERQYQRLGRYLEATRGTIAVGGGRDDAHHGLEPTVVVDPEVDEPLMQEEIFGPILPVVGVPTLEAGVALVNSRPKPLAVYVFSASSGLARRIVDQIPAGGAVINHAAMHCMVPSMPFGGVGASGIGAYHGETGFRTMSHAKAVLFRPQRPDLTFVYPPYGEKALKLFRRVF